MDIIFVISALVLVENDTPHGMFEKDETLKSKIDINSQN